MLEGISFNVMREITGATMSLNMSILCIVAHKKENWGR